MEPDTRPTPCKPHQDENTNLSDVFFSVSIVVLVAAVAIVLGMVMFHV